VFAELLPWAIFTVFCILGLAAAGRRRGPRVSRPGPAAIGSLYGLHNEDKRRAIELVLEQKAEARDPETADDKPETGR
jgi:hypothetical protein